MGNAMIIKPTLSIVVPCYNEQEMFQMCLEELSGRLKEMIVSNRISEHSNLVFVDDGSKDATWELISNASVSRANVRGIKLTRNKGHQTALIAGLSSCIDSDITVSIDADLQDDTAAISNMVDAYLNGNDIVYGVRNDRTSDSFFKRFTAQMFYNTMTKLGASQVKNHADFRLLSKRALNSLLMYQERNIYIRGLIPLVGYQSGKVFYARSKRIAGESKYPLKKMLSLAIEGITSLSITPLRIVTILGFIISIISFLMILYSLIAHFAGNTVNGWTSMILSIFFVGGVQMLCIGVLGEYIGKIYLETKKRPKYFIEEDTNQGMN